MDTKIKTTVTIKEKFEVPTGVESFWLSLQSYTGKGNVYSFNIEANGVSSDEANAKLLQALVSLDKIIDGAIEELRGDN